MSSNVTRFFIGVDLHKTVIQICVLDKFGEVVEERRHLARDLADGFEVIDSLDRYRKRGRLAVEAIGVNRWFVNELIVRGYDVTVCDPTKLNLKMLGKKTDRRDALEIARRLMLGDIDRNAHTYYPSDEEYGMRKVIRARHSLVEMRQCLMNQIRSLLNAYKITEYEGSLLTQVALKKLKIQVWPTEEIATTAQAFVTAMEGLSESINQLSDEIEEMAKESKIKTMIKQLPYAGPITVTTLIYELGDVTRFKNARCVASYVGLVPRVNQSADTSHHGRLTKRGNRELRHVMGEWAVRLMTHNGLVKQWAESHLKRSHKNKVRMALARRLLIGVYKMLLTGEMFSMERCLGMV